MNYPILVDPVLLEIGIVSIRWYGVMYLLAFGVLYFIGRWQIRHRDRFAHWEIDNLTDLIFYGIIGVLIGSRIGYALVYGWQNMIDDPLWLFKIWEGGHSFHGGLVGVLVSTYVWSRLKKRSFLEITDFLVPCVPIGLGLGRIGNYINVELPGRVTDTFLGVHFPCSTVKSLNFFCIGEYETVTRHLSSLYQAFAEGVVLFLMAWFMASRLPKLGQLSGLFLLSYGLLRFVTEFFREPDAWMGYTGFGVFTTGQLLSIPMIIFGTLFLVPISRGWFVREKLT